MSDENMPAAEAEVVVGDADLSASNAQADERNHYELAFHVLPTVAEGEVAGVFDAVKTLITSAGGELTTEEAPERFDLAYEIEQHIEGKNRKFSSAYFGWVRFKGESSMIEDLTEEVENHKDILRHLLIKLTKVEEAHPFRFHEALAQQKMVTTVEESSVVPDVTTVAAEVAAPVAEKKTEVTTEEPAEVDETELDKALEKDETA